MSCAVGDFCTWYPLTLGNPGSKHGFISNQVFRRDRMNSRLVLALLLFAPPALTGAAFCSSAPDDGERTNDFAIFDEEVMPQRHFRIRSKISYSHVTPFAPPSPERAISKPTFVKSTTNGALYEAGPENARFEILHVYGSAYEVIVVQPRPHCHGSCLAPCSMYGRDQLFT